MVMHILERCAVKTVMVDGWIRSRKVFYLSSNLPKVYILTSGVAYWLGCVAMGSIPGASEHLLLSAPPKSAFVYYARAIPKGENMGFKTATGFVNGAAYAVLSDKPLLNGMESILIETAEAAIVSAIKGRKFVAETMEGLQVGVEIFLLSQVANAINEYLFSEPVKAPIEPAVNVSNADMCMIGEMAKYGET
jgi:hypothetical protein